MSDEMRARVRECHDNPKPDVNNAPEHDNTFELADHIVNTLSRATQHARETGDVTSLKRMLGYVHGDIGDWLTDDAGWYAREAASLDANGRAMGTAIQMADLNDDDDNEPLSPERLAVALGDAHNGGL